MRAFSAVCVFCGSNPGLRLAYRRAGAAVGERLAHEGIAIVYGGGHVGMMGAVADAALAAGGRVIGVIPRQLVDRELAHRGLTELRIVGSMHERKQIMADLADGFIALPGGLGTFEEIMEAMTWVQLAIHLKPCGFLNVEGYYDALFALLDRAVEDGFLGAPQRRIAVAADGPGALLDAMRRWEPPPLRRWMDLEGR